MSITLLAAAADGTQSFWNFLAFFVGTTGLISSIVTAWLTHRHQSEAVKVDRFETITNALDKRIADLEGALTDEKKQHEATRNLLRVALRHLRAILVWAYGPRTEPLPDTPDELLDHII